MCPGSWSPSVHTGSVPLSAHAVILTVIPALFSFTRENLYPVSALLPPFLFRGTTCFTHYILVPGIQQSLLSHPPLNLCLVEKQEGQSPSMFHPLTVSGSCSECSRVSYAPWGSLRNHEPLALCPLTSCPGWPGCFPIPA